jgi:hypothetical protein
MSLIVFYATSFEVIRCLFKTVPLFQRAQGLGARGSVAGGVGFLDALKRCLRERIGRHLGISNGLRCRLMAKLGSDGLSAGGPNLGIGARRADLLLDFCYLGATGPCISRKGRTGDCDKSSTGRILSNRSIFSSKMRPSRRACPLTCLAR